MHQRSMHWSLGTKVQCEKVDVKDHYIEVLLRQFNAQVQCVELLHHNFNAKVQCAEVLNQKFNVKVQCKSSMHWSFI